ncbi:MAG: peptidoglycan DD-metalloendopeptidase family protein [Chloroflexi bacterium]|nr:peptidoglycan DD-metalloendopeptidase family protein [Chloroflexota bacterium]
MHCSLSCLALLSKFWGAVQTIASFPNRNYDFTTHQNNWYYSIDFVLHASYAGGSPSEANDAYIYPIASGKVIKAESVKSTTFGYVVYISHEGSLGGEFVSVYAHMKSPPVVKTGDLVIANTRLGIQGNTGTSDTTHLHLSLVHCASPLPPEESLKPGAGNCTSVRPEPMIGKYANEKFNWWPRNDGTNNQGIGTYSAGGDRSIGSVLLNDFTPPEVGWWNSGTTLPNTLENPLNPNQPIIFDVHYGDSQSGIGEIRLTANYSGWNPNPEGAWRIIARCRPGESSECGASDWHYEWNWSIETKPNFSFTPLSIPWMKGNIQGTLKDAGKQSVCISFDIFDKAGNPQYAPQGTLCNINTGDNGNSIRSSQDNTARLIYVNAGSPPTTTTDKATFISDITLPDGTVVSPGQALTKTWRVKNTGTSTWGSGYQLVYLRGERMGMPLSINVPSASPGQQVNLSIGLVTPSSPGEYFSYWRLRNLDGTYFGPELWVKVKVMDSQITNGAELINVAYPTVVIPGQSFRPEITIKVNSGSLQGARGDMLRNKDGNLFGAWPHVTVEGNVGANQPYTFVFYENNPITAPATPGTYTSIWQVWADGRYIGPEIEVTFRVFSGNYPPNSPNLNNPGDYASGYDIPQFCAVHTGDPDGDAITGYQFEFVSGATSWQSGWVTPPSNCAWPDSMAPGQYAWHARVKDSNGNVSNWSNEIRHFTRIAGVDITLFEFDHSSPSDAEQIWIHTNGVGDFNETILTVNTATDCSSSGEWRGINHYAGGREVNSLWGTLGLLDGCHKIRLEIKGIGGADVEERNFTLLHRRPSNPFAIHPDNNSWVDSKTVTFSWQTGVQPNLTYRLVVSQNPNPASDPNPLFDQEFHEEKLSHTITFNQDYQNLYWFVTATNDKGANDSGVKHFGIDEDPPVSRVEYLPPVTTITQFTIRWSGEIEGSGLHWYRIQFKDGDRGDWQDWLIDTTKTAEIFSGQPGHVYYFRAQAIDNVGNWEDWSSGSGDTYTFVDPSAVPPTPWWNNNYAYKRNIVILNNDGDSMIAHYPIRVHFDASTNPTSAELYNASSSSIKGDDVRVVYNDQTELSRFVQRFTPDQIDIWFALQSPLAGGASNESDYQIYYNYPNAPSPTVDINAIFLPVSDTNTIGLWHFQDGTGSSIMDTSGRGHNGTFYNPGWDEGWLSWTGLFSGSNSYVDVGNSNDFNLTSGPMTLEAWIYLDHIVNSPPIISKWGDSDDYASYFLRIRNDRKVWWLIRAPGGNREVVTGLSLTLKSWYHIAATYNGVNTMHVFVNGERWGDNTNAADGFNSSSSLKIGYDGLPGGGATYFPGYIQHVQISNIERTSFPYAFVSNAPSVGVGNVILPPESGSPDLVVIGISTYPSTTGGILIEAIVKNQGDISTLNGFYTDLYVDRIPTGAGDYSGSIEFWINDPIGPGEIATLTTLVTDVSQFLSSGDKVQPGGETNITLYAQTDSSGAITETDNGNNIYSQGIPLCLASTDAFEADDTYNVAPLITKDVLQTHNFDTPGDRDWVKFSALVGKKYRLTTSGLGLSSDTYLYIYSTNGTTLIASNDDFNNTLASQIEWTAPQTGTFYARIQHWNPNAGGCGTSYNIVLSEVTAPKPGAFNKLTPASASVNQPTNLTLSWGASAGATSYEYCYDTTNDNACTPWVNNGAATSKALTGLVYNTTYYWNVRARNANGITNSSGAFWSFKTAPWSIRSTGAKDGWILETAENSNVGGSMSVTGSLRIGDQAANKQYRSMLHFNTSGIPDNATITKVTLKIKKLKVIGADPFTTHGRLIADIRKGFFGLSNLALTDFQSIASKNSVGRFNALSGAPGWYQMVMNSTGHPFINLTGATQFRLRFVTDDDNDSVADYVTFFAGDDSVAANRPVLIVEYTLP